MIDFTLSAKWKASSLCFFFILFYSIQSNAQSRTVTGKIVDSKSNETLIGATVQIKGSTTGTATDINGGFTIKADQGDVLEIKSIGYTTVTVPADFNNPMLIRLNPTNTALNEVLVVGYATQRKADLTGAVSSIRSSDIADLPVGGADQILQGKAAGVAVTQNTGAPGDGINVLIRGVGTINNNNPLYVIDGIPTQNGINEISPNDIESISVLKDASSAAIYGARAANGVVIVTTKRGKKGPPKVSLNAYSGVQTPQHLIKMANTSEYVSAFNTAAAADGRAQIPASLISTLPDVNWQKEVLRPSPISNVQLGISGGSENTTYIVSSNYFAQDGLIQNSSYDRLNLRTAINSNISKVFTVGTNLNLSYAKNRQVGTSGDGYGAGNPGASVVRYALFRTPATPVFNQNGQYVDIPDHPEFFGDGLNPVGFADNYNRNFNNYSVLGNVFLEINPVKNLKIRSDFGTNFLISDYKQFFATWGIDRFLNSPNSLAQSNTTQFDYNWTNTATYNLTVAEKHVFNFLIGSELIKSNTQAFSASRTVYSDQSSTFQYLDNGLGIQQNGGNQTHWALFSLFGRVNYAYNDKYLATFNFRRDGSSRLDPSNQYGNFYGGSLGWRIDQEEFMKDIKPISLLKLRAGIGQLGNQEIGNYSYATLISSAGYYPFNGTGNQGNAINTLGNPNVRWETSTQTDIGLDLGLFNSALQISADYFIKNTSGMLLQPAKPTSAGSAASAFVNAGSMRNQGFEFEVNYRNGIGKKVKYSVIGNLSVINNKVTSLAGGSPLVGGRIDNNYYATQTAVGQPVGSFYLLQQEGIFQNAQQVFTHAYQGPGIQPGDVMFKDISGPNGKPDGIIDEYDRTYVGSPIPKLTYGLTGNLSYAGFDVSLFFQGVYGNKLYNQINTDIEGFYRSFNITERAATESWTGEGSTNEFPRLSWNGATNNKRPSTRFLEDGSYLRLKNIQLGYTIGDKLVKRLKITSVRVFVSAQNVFTVTKYTGIDPEIYTNSNSSGDGVRAVGIDWGTYPSARTFTAGVSANF
ncbi:SusC/RagA family TonB-linked outer membrane protein [Mucilaginibacter arboris]|uniref:SusC/RagA family TonB-linked outer membrane protein n=1 Tax=Mucilaginibacter arboris TaxID=2682090 RepID=A0A7K1SSZ8_9SPHI|nr:TonB-dependent receptor [Mucilaginibacter arboris]MVN20415.1 SusC/RagA family TonB-linked outer membrane protein [Mucilaginibacter arboris]